MITRWRPRSEAEATSNGAAFVEWLRATQTRADATQAMLPAWALSDDPAFPAAIGAFLRLDPTEGAAHALRGGRLLRCRGAGTVEDARGAGVFDGPDGWAALLACATTHLLLAETRPDDRLLWLGTDVDPWPVAGLLFGATIILGGGPATSAARESASVTWSAAPAFAL